MTIYTLERNNVCCVPSKALRFVPDPGMMESMGYSLAVPEAGKKGPMAPENICWVLNGTQLEPRTVTVGQSDGEMTEIISGVTEGETVVTGVQTAVLPVKAAQQERSPFMPGPPR